MNTFQTMFFIIITLSITAQWLIAIGWKHDYKLILGIGVIAMIAGIVMSFVLFLDIFGWWLMIYGFITPAISAMLMTWYFHRKGE